MAATNQTLFHFFLATVLVNALLETTVAYEDSPEHDEDTKHHHSDAANETDDHDRKFHWPSSVTIGINREAKVDGPDHPNPGNDTDGARKFHWPSSVSITIHRSGQVDSDAARQMDGPNAPANDTDGERKFHWPGSVSFEIHREAKVDGPDHPNPGNDTDGGRKFHWPSSATLTIHRAGQVDYDAARQMDGPNAPGNYTDGERKFHWPGSVSFEIHREAKVDRPDHPTPVNDTEDGERRFRWPSTVGLTISRTGQALHHGNPLAPEDYKPDQEEKSFGFLPVLVSCNHTTQAGRTCADCTHSLLCFSNNLGFKRDCGPRYCDDGRCSSQPSSNCTDASNE